MEYASPAPVFDCTDPGSILSLNRDMEPYVIQASAARNDHFRDPVVPLQFVHCSDIHAALPLWNRMAEYVNHYRDYIAFVLHTGDYVGNYQGAWTDLYAQGAPCCRPILNCVGNHDTYAHNTLKKEPFRLAPPEDTHALLFNHTDGWDVTFAPLPSPMSYYRDFPGSGIRLIVLDLYYRVEEQKTWLRGLLDEAREKNISVITAAHTATDRITRPADTTFQTLPDYGIAGGQDTLSPFETDIAAFIAAGGQHICHLGGHRHVDWFGHTDAGVLNILVECGTDWNGWTDGLRAKNARNWDCFNVFCADTVLGLVKLVRIGDCSDHFLRLKHALCYDYRRRKVISNF